MKICKTEKEYVDAIALAVQKCCKRYGYLPSVLIAQSCLENGYGIPDYWDNAQIEALLKYNNMVGMKSELLNSSWSQYTVWTGESLTKNTPEEYDGKKVIIKDNFRKYDNIEQSFADFLLFMTYASNYGEGGAPKYGQPVLSIKSPQELIQSVKDRGYATDSAYPKSVMKIINKHDLTKYDDLSKVDATVYTPGYHESKTKKLKAPKFIDNRAASKSQVPKWRSKSDIKYIVVHYLGVVGENFELWDNGYGATFTIAWNGNVYWTADYTAVTWQCGGGRQGSGGSEFFGKCTNFNSVSIENCVKRTDGRYEGDDNDNKWFFTEQTQESLVWAVSKMMDDLGIPIERVIRHYDVTGKICPNPYVKNNGLNGNWTWQQFKKNLAQYRKDGTIAIPQGKGDSDDPAITSITLKKGDRGEPVAEMQRMLIACGYSCGSYGADGVFGSSTEKTLKAFQKASGLKVDGLYGENSKNALTNAYVARGASGNKKTTANTVFLKAAKNVADTARVDGWTYGDSRSRKPFADKKIRCDRLVARTLFDLGFRDQRDGGEVCSTLDKYLVAHGWKKVTQKSDIKAGAVIAVRNKSHSYIDHVFIVSSYNKEKDTCSKYDTGSDIRIKSVQPFKNVPLVEWSNRVFVCAWNVPAYLASSKPGLYVWDGVDYGAVFNPTYYSKMHKDLKDVFGTDSKKLFEHFLKCGMREGRQAYAGFCVHAYRDRYADLKKAFGSDLPLYYKHYCEFGLKEKRIGT